MSRSDGIKLGYFSTLESSISTLMAERECYRTFFDYFDFIDKKLPCERAAECFTEDAEIAYHMKGEAMAFRGRSDYLSFLQSAMGAQEMTAHVVGQHRFEWSNGKPRLLAYVTSWQWFKVNAHLGDMRPTEFATIGYSEDDFECVSGKWLIARRIAKPVAGLVAVGTPPPPLH